MRYCLLLAAFWLIFGVARAAPAPADTAALRIARLPAAGLLLSKGWRYHAGDNPAWARPDFDDRSWDTITVGRDGFPLPLRARRGAGWFRLRLRLADSLRVQALGLTLTQSLAGFEVYADGRRIGRGGVFSTNSARVQAAGTISPLSLVAINPELVLAVRFAPWTPPLLLRAAMANNIHLDFELRLLKQRQLRHQQQRGQSGRLIEALLGGAFLLLGLLHLAFFRYNPSQRANAYFALYALIGAASHCLSAFPTGEQSGLWAQQAVFYLSISSFLFGFVAGLRALYALFEERPGWVYVGLCLLAGLPVIGLVYADLVGTNDKLPAVLLASVIMLTLLMQLRLTWRAVRQRRRGSLLIGGGFGAGLLLVVSSALMYGLFPQWRESDLFNIIREVVYNLAGVAPVLSISLYLAREFALDAELLQVKLREVEHLSAQTLAQEQEKQALLAQQNDTLETQVAERTGELQRSLTELRATQAQLIQKEKMASLGELTAGIAHEIQNPLNFVNNFADVSQELVQELKEAQATGDAAEVAALADDLTQNLGKIHQHGRRAAGIVRGMLEHSRASTGARQPTDINALADEYLRLAYHGLRAKDKTFNATLETDFEAGLPLVEAVSQDLGRVLLNLFSNAFYAVQQRQRAGEPGYAPTVRVATRQVAGGVEVQVADNGPGIAPEVQAKIFQPFFTTKPTGEGTGLGLSLSYDIVTQGHSGTFGVASQVGQGTTFTIRLPQ